MQRRIFPKTQKLDMECEACGDEISLSTAYRDDNGNFVCQECHTKFERTETDSQQQRRTQSVQQQRTAPASTEAHTEQYSSGSGSRTPANRAQTPRAETDAEDGYTPDSGQLSEPRFNTLLSISKLISGVGWVIVGLAAVAGIVGIVAAMSLPPPPEEAVMALAGGLGGGLWFAVMGLLTVASGQVVSCFVAIERNTRSTYEMIRSETE